MEFLAKEERNFVVGQENKAEQILSNFGIKEGDPIAAPLLREIIMAKEKEIREGIARNFYHAIKGSLYRRRTQSIDSPYYLLRRPRQYAETSDNKELDFVWFLNTKAESTADKWARHGDLKLIFTFKADAKRIEEEEQKVTVMMFSGPGAFSLERIMLSDVSLESFDDPELRNGHSDIRAAEVQSERMVSYDNVRAFLKQVLREPELFPEADKRIDEIWREHGFPIEDAKNLKQSIYEFGNYDFTVRDGYSMIGQCLIIPHDFEVFVRLRFGIRLQRCELTGATQRLKSYSPEERAELAAEQEMASVHEASIYRSAAIIDWTSRQFRKTSPIPEITDLTHNESLKERIEITGEA